jgi:hypothetical protein
MRMSRLGKWATIIAVLGLQTAVAASATIRTEAIYSGELCTRCKRIILERHVAAELAGEAPQKFRTIRCMLTYLQQNAAARAADVYVVDYQTGKLVPAREAVYVPVPIDGRTGIANYGVGDIDYLAFKSEHEGDRVASEYGVTTLSWPAVRYYAAFLPSRDVE